jgi:4-hydroxyphenylpyruvate dioxygenase
MKKSIATVSLGGKLTDKLEAIAAAGFESIEIFEPKPPQFIQLIGAWLRMIRRCI